MIEIPLVVVSAHASAQIASYNKGDDMKRDIHRDILRDMKIHVVCSVI